MTELLRQPERNIQDRAWRSIPFLTEAAFDGRSEANSADQLPPAGRIRFQAAGHLQPSTGSTHQ